MDILRLDMNSPLPHYSAVAALHIQEIHHGMLPILGQKFLARLYSRIAIAPQSCIYMAIDNSKIIGFIAGTADIRKCYRSVLLGDWLSLSFLGLNSALQVHMLKRILTLLIYPFNSSTSTRHTIEDCERFRSEILTVAVEPGSQRKGVGRKLIEAFENELERWKVTGYYRVATNIVEENSNSFYKRLGFAPCHLVKHNQLTLQVYLKPIQDQVVQNSGKERQVYVS